MEKIRLHFVDFYDSSLFAKESITDFTQRFGASYKFTLDSKNPQFLFYGAKDPIAELNGEHCLYPDACKIFITGECVIPNFNFYDYAIGNDYLNLGDRYIRCPDLYLNRVASINKNWKKLSKEEVKARKKFCNLIYSHGSMMGWTPRKDFFTLLSQYKKVDAAGVFLRNTDDLARLEVKMRRKDDEWTYAHYEIKRMFIKDYKFTIAFENQSYPGYTTEKILDAFMSRTVPIYWGNPRVTEDFVPSAFINANDFASLEDLAEEVKRLDQDDEAYMEMLNTHPIPEAHRSGDYWGDRRAQFLKSIFDQGPVRSRRRPSMFPYEMDILNRNAAEKKHAPVAPGYYLARKMPPRLWSLILRFYKKICVYPLGRRLIHFIKKRFF